MMNDFNLLLNTLSVPYKKDEEPSIFIAKNLDKDILSKFNIKYSEEAEGVRIDLFDQKDLYLFKTKTDFYIYVKKEYFEKPILILEDQLFYNQNERNHFIFDNIKYSFKIFNVIKDKLSAHQDIINRQFIFLSSKLGKDVIGYKNDHETDLNNDLNLKEKYEKLQNKISSSEDFISFLRDNILAQISSSNKQNRYIKILNDFDIIYQNAERDINLYKSKFSFLDFKESLESEKQKYIKETQNHISEFSSKINLPIQFGVFIFLINRFSQEFYPLLASLAIVFFWSIFQISSAFFTRGSICKLNESVQKSFDKIRTQTNLDLENTPNEIDKRMKHAKLIIDAYLLVTGVFSIAAIAIIIYFLCKL